MRSPIKLEFSEKYDKDHAREYFLKHQDGLARRLSHKRDEQLARRALTYANGRPSLQAELWNTIAQAREKQGDSAGAALARQKARVNS